MNDEPETAPNPYQAPKKRFAFAAVDANKETCLALEQWRLDGLDIPDP